MTDYQIDALLASLIIDIDYDYWKELFIYDNPDDEAEETKKRLRLIVRKWFTETFNS